MRIVFNALFSVECCAELLYSHSPAFHFTHLQIRRPVKIKHSSAFCVTNSRQISVSPLLEQQPAEYLVAAITAYKTHQRFETSMNVNAANLSEADIRDIADYFASKEFPIRTQNLEPAKIAAGATLVRDMSCANCHDGSFHGAKMMPRLAGQNVLYLVGQLEAFRDGRRNLPTAMAVPKDRTEIEDIASYLASLP